MDTPCKTQCGRAAATSGPAAKLGLCKRCFNAAGRMSSSGHYNRRRAIDRKRGR